MEEKEKYIVSRNTTNEMTNREWLETLSHKDLAEFLTLGLVVRLVANPEVMFTVNIVRIGSRYSQSTIGVEEWLQKKREFMTLE